MSGFTSLLASVGVRKDIELAQCERRCIWPPIGLGKRSTNMNMSDDFEECKGILRFRVPIGDGAVEAYLSRTTCETALRQAPGEGSLAAFYRQHQPVLDGIVLGKVDSGARQPVVLMARDLQSQPVDLIARTRAGSTPSDGPPRVAPERRAI